VNYFKYIFVFSNKKCECPACRKAHVSFSLPPVFYSKDFSNRSNYFG